MMGAELNASIEEEWPAPEPHLQQWRNRRGEPGPAVAPQPDEVTAASQLRLRVS